MSDCADDEVVLVWYCPACLGSVIKKVSKSFEVSHNDNDTFLCDTCYEEILRRWNS